MEKWLLSETENKKEYYIRLYFKLDIPGERQ